jgi:MFS transporter, MHS family, alpha-ketoglutarate permease
VTEQITRPASDHIDVADAERRIKAVFIGTAPAIALYFKSIGHEKWFYHYLAGVICLSLIIYSTMRDTKHASAMHRHE